MSPITQRRNQAQTLTGQVHTADMSQLPTSGLSIPSPLPLAVHTLVHQIETVTWRAGPWLLTPPWAGLTPALDVQGRLTCSSDIPPASDPNFLILSLATTRPRMGNLSLRALVLVVPQATQPFRQKALSFSSLVSLFTTEPRGAALH